MAKNLIRLDIIEGKPRTFVADVDMEQGLFVEVTGKAVNPYLGGEADYEAYAVKLATATCSKTDLLLHASVPNMYGDDEAEADFELKAGKPGRGYMPVLGDLVTLPATVCGGTVSDKGALTGVAVGDILVLAGEGKLAKASTDEDAVEVAIAKVEAIEVLTAPACGGQWTAEGVSEVQDVAQVSCVVRFF